MKKLAACATLALLSQLTASTLAPQTVQPAFARSEGNIAVTDEQINGKSFCVSTVLVHASPTQVWKVITDYQNAPRVFPMMKKCEVLEDRGNTKILKHKITPSGPAGTFEYTLEMKENSPKSAEWHRLSGDFREVDGYWKLEPAESGHSTLVTYQSHVLAGWLTPPMLVKRQCHADIPVIMSTLKRQAEDGEKVASGRLASVHTQ